MINQLISILKNRDVVSYLTTIIIVPLSSALFTQIFNPHKNAFPILKKYIGGDSICMYLIIMSILLYKVSDFLVFFLNNIIVISIALNIVIIGMLTLLLCITNLESVAWILFIYIAYIIMYECGARFYGAYFPFTLIAINMMFMKPILKNKYVEEEYRDIEYSKEIKSFGITYFYLCFCLPFIIVLYTRILANILLIVFTSQVYVFFAREIYDFRCSKIDIVVSGQLFDDISVYDIELIKQYIKINSPGREELFININNIQTITCHGNGQRIYKKSLVTMIIDSSDVKRSKAFLSSKVE